jgi:hypothetical protein
MMENHVDLAGRFPRRTISQYQLVMYAENSNYIHVELMTSRNAKEFVAAYSRAIALFAKRGMKPKFLRFHNENATALDSFADTLMTSPSNMHPLVTTVQTAPNAPSRHRENTSSPFYALPPRSFQ